VDQNKGRTALAMGVIMMILGAVAMVISFTHPRALPEPPHSPPASVAAAPSAQPLDERADELARQLTAAQVKLSTAEARLVIERGANEGIRKEINEMRLAKQDIEARLQGVAAERELEKKTLAAVQANLDKATADLAKLRTERAEAAAKAQAEIGKAKAEAQAEIAKINAISKAEMEKAKAEAKALEDKASRLDRLNQSQAQLITALTVENAKLKQDIQRLQGAPAAAPPETGK